MYYWLLLAYPSHIASSDDVGQQDALVLILGGGGYDAEDDKPQPSEGAEQIPGKVDLDLQE